MSALPARERVRLAELLAALSLGSDLGMGLPMEHVLRQCLIAIRLADRVGVDVSDRIVVYYSALLAWVGCHIDAYEQAKWFGDDLELKAGVRRVDFTGPTAKARFMLTHFGEGRPFIERAKLGAELLGAGWGLKSPYTLGHSRGVAELAEAAARDYGLPADECKRLRRAGLVHDLGRLGVSNAIWDKPGALSPAEFERVRLHPYLTERILASSPTLAPLGALAVEHHERLDGSGYPRGLAGNALSPASRILAVADAYRTRLEPRPHRPACSAQDAAAHLRSEADGGRLDGGAVDSVLRAAGQHVAGRRSLPAGLTPREVEVLRLLALGLTHAEIAERLVISRKTARNHVEHIYQKIGVSSRALASLFAVRHGLIGDV